MPVKVKICGITNLADGMAAAEAGADAVGFVFYDPSPRSVSIEAAAQIIPALPPFLVKVGLFVDAPEDLVYRAIGQCGLTLLQFHGTESPEYCTQFGLMSMKAFRVRDHDSLLALADYKTDAWLLDAYSSDKLGGTGEKFNWDLAIEAQKLGRPIFLAGGLTPENVAEAVRRVHPYGVDVSSGVEAVPGRKDHAKVRAFIQQAKSEAGSSLAAIQAEQPSRKIEVREITTEEALPLRLRVLRPGRPVESARFPGDEAPSTRHFGSFLDGRLLGIATLLLAEMPGQPGSLAFQLRGMATAPEARRTGLGRALVNACSAFSREKKAAFVWCNARTTALGFYRKMEFDIVSPEFVVPDVGPHFRMALRL